MADSIGLIVGLVLTLFIYSYLVGDNPLYRIAVHILIGVSAAYAAVIAVNRILYPVLVRVIENPAATNNVLWLVPIVLSLLLAFKSLRSISWVGNTSVGLLVTAGAAVALLGAVSGTVIPQVTRHNGDNPLNLLLITLLVVCVLLYFQFSEPKKANGAARAGAGTASVRLVGQLVLMITFGAVFAGVFTTSLILLIERVSYFITGLSSLIGLILL